MSSGNTTKKKTKSSASSRQRRGSSNSYHTKGNSKKSRSSKSNTRKNTQQLSIWEDPVAREIILVLVACLAILLFLCNFGIIGPVGNAISSVMFGLFGLFSYILPLLVAGLIFFHASNYGSRHATIKIIACICFFFLMGIFAEVFHGVTPNLEVYEIKEIYKYSSLKHGGGVISGSIAYFLCRFLSRVGCIFLTIALSIINIILITEKSLLNLIQSGGKYALEKTKSGVDKSRQYSYERRQNAYEKRMQKLEEEELAEQERILRMDKKAEGVSLQNLSFEQEQDESYTKIRDDIHEIILQEEETTKPKKKRATKVTKQELEQYLSKEPGQLQETPDIFNEELMPVQETEVEFDFETIPIETYQYEAEPEPEPMEQYMEVQEQDFVETSYEEPMPREDRGPVRSNPEAGKRKVREKLEADVTEQTAMEIEKAQSLPPREYIYPPLNLLKKTDRKKTGDSQDKLRETAQRLQQTLQNFGVNVTITNISQGPTVTRYELQPEQGVKVSKIVSLTDDIKLNLAATDIRMEAPIPGKAAIGIEVPNTETVSVGFHELVASKEFKEFPSKLCFAVGKDIGGKVILADIAKMPHLLIAGSTGSGKSVCINTIIMSLLYKASPDEVKMIMIDPKVVELSVYNGIPHLLIPVVTEPKKAAGALQWGVAEMTDRYKRFADFNVRDIKGYNAKLKEMEANHEENIPAKMPQVVIIVDELADLMMVAPGEVEESICRLAQLARAAGIHLIIATQRPSVDVITGLIKANMPSRVAFAVSSGVDSRTILDQVGAEKLLGKGDMLFYPQGYTKPARIQGAFISDDEVSNVVDFLKNQVIGNIYDAEIQEKIQSLKTTQASGGAGSDSDSGYDELFEQAARRIFEREKASIGDLQRGLKVGFNRAARIMDQLCEAGIVGEEEGTKPRKILMTEEEFEQFVEEYL